MIRRYTAIAVIAAMISGCASVSQYGGYTSNHSSRAHTQRIEPKKYYVLQEKVCKADNLEDLLGNIEDFSKSAESNKSEAIIERQLGIEYNNMLDEINQLVENKKYSLVKNKISSAVKSLQKKNFNSRDKYIETFRNYSYTRTDYVSPVYEEKYNMSLDGIAVGLIFTPFVVLSTVAGTLLGQDGKVKKDLEDYKKCFAEKTIVKVKQGYYTVFRVIPYSKKEVLVNEYQ